MEATPVASGGELVPDTAITGTIVEPELEGWGNIYGEPGKLGLEIVGEADDELASYSFDMFVVWRDQRGALYYASDSGCSCPSPFEDYKKLSDLTKAASVADVHAALNEWTRSDDDYRRVGPTAAELHAKLADLAR